MRRTRRSRHDDQGAVAIVVALFSIVMFVFAALVVDLGVAREIRREAQNAADASSLAAANALYLNTSTPSFPAAVQAAKSYAAANVGTTDADWAACSTSDSLGYAPGGTSCISFDSSTTPMNVRVVVPPRIAGSFFGGIVGYAGMEVDALAQAQVERDGQPPCVFCVLGQSPHDLQNGTLDVSNGDIWINGDVTLGPQGSVLTTNGTTYVQGTIDNPSRVEDPKVTGVDAVADPLAFLSVPPSDLPAVVSVKLDPCSDGPGYYGGYTFSSSTPCNLNPGLYVFTEPLRISGSGNFTATNSTLYFACGTAGIRGSCATDTNPGTFEGGGSGRLRLDSPSEGPRKRLAIVYDRDNPATLSLRGETTGGRIVGTVYAPGATLDVRGGACGNTFRSMVVVRDLRYSGTPSCFKTSYAASDNVELPGGSGLVQ